MSETYYSIKKSTLTGIADAVRSKTGDTAQIAVSRLAEAISGIEAGSPGGAVTEYSQVNSTVQAYLKASEAYVAGDLTSTVMPGYSDYTDTTLEDPAGYAIDVSAEGTVLVQDETDGDGWKDSVLAGAYTVYNLLPAHTSTVAVVSNNAVAAIKRLKPTGTLRMIHMDGVHNFRDLGGWACDGGTIKYNKIIRGAQLDNAGTMMASSRDLYTMSSVIGILTEVDLRTASQAGSATESVIGKQVDYARYDIGDSAYLAMINLAGSAYKITAQAIKHIMESVVKNKPVYIHCQAGADRTGVVCCLLEGILGVGGTDRDRDYELTAFYGILDYSDRVRTNSGWVAVYTYINGLTGDSFRDKVLRWMVTAGVPLGTINDFRAAMSTGTPETLSYGYSVTNNLSNVTTSNTAASALSGASYTATLTPSTDYAISTVTVTMGGTDITSSAWDAGTKTITISNVTGAIVISAVAQSNMYAITYALTSVICDNSAASVVKGAAYTAHLTASDGYNIDSVVVTMGGIDVTSKVYTSSTGVIIIDSVTGDVVITASASVPIVNQLPLATDADGNLYNDGTGYKSGYRLNSLGADSAQSAAYVTGFIPCKKGQTIKLTNIHLPAFGNVANMGYCYIALYDSSKALIKSNYSKDYYGDGSNTPKTDDGSWITELTLNRAVGGSSVNIYGLAYIRISALKIDDTSEIYIK